MPVLSTHDELRSVLADSQTPTLFVSPGVQRWGRFDFNRLALEQHDKQQPGDDELLDLATAQTLRHDGTVYGVKPEDVPGGQLLAAVYRY